MPASVFDGFMEAARQDAQAWMKGFLDNFYNIGKLRGTLVSEQAYQAGWNLAASASTIAAVAFSREPPSVPRQLVPRDRA
jgi:hypothetical protein